MNQRGLQRLLDLFYGMPEARFPQDLLEGLGFPPGCTGDARYWTSGETASWLAGERVRASLRRDVESAQNVLLLRRV